MEIRDSFLLDEVRCGFMVPAAVKQAWAAELEVLAEIDRVCKKHNIQYFADCGTLLGAVRHGGFIPWDDDLDIVMKREDYNKFMTVARFDMVEGFDVQTYRNQDDYWFFIGKVVGKNGFCFEKEHLRKFHNFPYIACVDIFVLDYVYRDPEKEKKRRTLCNYMLGMANAIVREDMTSTEKERRLKTLEEMYGKKISRIEDAVEMGRYLYGEVEKIFAEVPEDEADGLTRLNPWVLKGGERHYEKEYFEQAIYLPFEGITIPVPIGYDKLLQKRYKGYMRLVKDAGAHDYPFFEGQKKNLQKVMDFELPAFRFERDKMFRSKEEESYREQAYKAMVKECTDELQRMKEQIADLIKTADTRIAVQDQIVKLLQDSQQLAVDLGNMLEQFWSEDNSIIPLLEQYCEVLYIFYEKLLSDAGKKEMAVACDRLNELQKALIYELDLHVLKRKTVLFFPVLAQDWSSLHNMWQKLAEEPDCDVFVVPLPYFYKDYDGSPRKICYDATEFPEELKVLDYRLLTPEYLEMLHPEMIIIQNPYDGWNPAISVPEMFYSENIRKYTEELIYVPPFVVEEYSKRNEREYLNMKYYVTMPGVVNADRVMVQSENMRLLYIEKLVEFAGEETREVWEQRVVVRELPIMEQEINPKKKILYGISIGAYMGDVEAAREKIRNNLQLFEKYKAQLDWTIQLFPNNDVVAEIRNDILQVLADYRDKLVDVGVECRAKDYDAYYGDAMPVVMDFREAGKPAMIQDYERVN